MCVSVCVSVLCVCAVRSYIICARIGVSKTKHILSVEIHCVLCTVTIA